VLLTQVVRARFGSFFGFASPGCYGASLTRTMRISHVWKESGPTVWPRSAHDPIMWSRGRDTGDELHNRSF
jgi:hypothetical protein